MALWRQQLVDLRRQDKIILRKPFDRMGIQFNTDVVPGMDGDVRVMALLLGQIADAIDKSQRFLKILEFDVAGQLAFWRGPAWYLLHHGLSLLGAQWWRVAPAGNALPVCQRCHILLLTLFLPAQPVYRCPLVFRREPVCLRPCGVVDGGCNPCACEVSAALEAPGSPDVFGGGSVSVAAPAVSASALAFPGSAPEGAAAGSAALAAGTAGRLTAPLVAAPAPASAGC